jgi:hypothetical protein
MRSSVQEIAKNPGNLPVQRGWSNQDADFFSSVEGDVKEIYTPLFSATERVTARNSHATRKRVRRMTAIEPDGDGVLPSLQVPVPATEKCRVSWFSLAGMGDSRIERIFMRYKLARLLQLAGLVILPVAIAGNAVNQLELRDSLGMSAFGMVVFFAGWLLQKGTKPQ